MNATIPLLEPADIDFAAARPVISRAQKYIVPVAAFEDGDPLVYPPGTEKAGEPITDWQGNPIGQEGIIFFNAVDKCYQAAPSDGRSVIIINEVTSEQADALDAFAGDLGEPADALSKASIEALLTHARSPLGLKDMYNSDDTFVRAKMTPVHGRPAGDAELRPHGLMKRDDRDICQAVFVLGPARFQGPAATPQEIPASGAFVIRQTVGAKTDYRVADAGAMLRTYLHADGRPLALRDFEGPAGPPTAPR
jgi:hypothetical protein